MSHRTKQIFPHFTNHITVMNFKFILSFFLSTIVCFQLFGQCNANETEVEFHLTTDNWGYETSWSITDDNGTVYASVPTNTYGNLMEYDTAVCVPNGLCLTFTLNDVFGDGIVPPGHALATIDGDTLLFAQGDFDNFTNATFNCPPGSSCGTSEVVGTGVHASAFDDYFYEFTPPENGIYNVTTCDLGNTCDSKIWVYSTCDDILVDESNIGTQAYNDNADCGLNAELDLFLMGGAPIYIRIGDNMDMCNNMPITWALSYVGPISGCTNNLACNFNPLATVDDGSCLSQGDPNCPDGPDLVLDQEVFETSIYLDTYFSSANSNNDNCLVEEQCLQGYGNRDLIRFTTTIHNTGELDYYLGVPSFDNPLFTWDNCHNHWHYDGYAEYLLYDVSGQKIPIGFKNGFCVIDLECPMGITQQFTCNNMGITAGCSDTYHALLECQWLDVTDIPDGAYTMVARTNWENEPDYNGRIETNIVNNWAQACIEITRPNGVIQLSVDADCEPFTDCAGEPYGSAQFDCTGICGGSVLMGDIDQDGDQTMTDAQSYVIDILGNDITPTSCNDLNADGEITVYDAALLSTCNLYGANHNHPTTGAHDHCVFPDGVVSIFDSTYLHIDNIDYDNQHIDIHLNTSTTDVVAYQFAISGVTIQSVENLVDAEKYPVIPQANISEGMVIGISFQDSTITRNINSQPLVRVHYMAVDSDSLVCIDAVHEVVNYNYEQTIPTFGPCMVFETPILDNVNEFAQIKVSVQPNPFTNQTLLRFQNDTNEKHRLELTDMSGKQVRLIENIEGTELTITRNNLPQGIYMYRLTGEERIATGKLVVQ